MDHTQWAAMSPAEREKARDNSDLTPALKGLEGWRVEVVDAEGGRRRFIVGRSTGWRPCHLELHNIRSMGGFPAWKNYQSVRPIRRVRNVGGAS